MRLSLSLGAWWPEGRSSSSVSQFLSSCSWSACQMAAKWKDVYRGDLSPWWFLQLYFCSIWGRCPAEREEQTLRCAQLSARLSAELCSPDLWRYYTTLRYAILICYMCSSSISYMLTTACCCDVLAVAKGTTLSLLIQGLKQNLMQINYLMLYEIVETMWQRKHNIIKSKGALETKY